VFPLFHSLQLSLRGTALAHWACSAGAESGSLRL